MKCTVKFLTGLIEQDRTTLREDWETGGNLLKTRLTLQWLLQINSHVLPVSPLCKTVMCLLFPGGKKILKVFCPGVPGVKCSRSPSTVIFPSSAQDLWLSGWLTHSNWLLFDVTHQQNKAFAFLHVTSLSPDHNLLCPPLPRKILFSGEETKLGFRIILLKIKCFVWHSWAWTAHITGTSKWLKQG